MSAPRHLEVIYCDDIREEVGNKFSYMGVYSGELVVARGAVVLPKLCVAVKAVTDIADPFETLVVRLVQGDDEVELVSTGPIVFQAGPAGLLEGTTRQVTQLAFMLAPFQIDEESILRVKAVTEREELQSMALRIRLAALSGKAASQ